MDVQKVRDIGSKNSGVKILTATEGIRIGCHRGSGNETKNETTTVIRSKNPLIMVLTATAPIQ
tara:strand:- start:123 stop:311 length:189 start_codon:yes stop_codon:yes gene_type:complete